MCDFPPSLYIFNSEWGVSNIFVQHISHTLLIDNLSETSAPLSFVDCSGDHESLIKQNNHRGETSFEASCQVDAFPGQNDAFTFDLTNVER